jgi:hypothetical protein
MSLYIKELVDSPQVLPMLPTLVRMMTTTRYDNLLRSLHICDPASLFKCTQRVQLIMLAAWTAVLNEEINARLHRNWSQRDQTYKCWEKSVRQVWVEKVQGFGLHSYNVHEGFNTPGNVKAKECIMQIIRKIYEAEYAFPGWQRLDRNEEKKVSCTH